mgnify:FL=1
MKQMADYEPYFYGKHGLRGQGQVGNQVCAGVPLGRFRNEGRAAAYHSGRQFLQEVAAR